MIVKMTSNDTPIVYHKNEKNSKIFLGIRGTYTELTQVEAKDLAEMLMESVKELECLAPKP